MKLFVNLFLIFIAGSFAVEELDEESVAHLTDDLLHEIEKRLRDDPSMLDALMEKSGGLLDMLGSECTHAVTNNTIIETEKSIENGAIFLLTPDVTSFTDCLNICCDTENCNTAIFKDRDNSFACYLFDCGNPNVCQFTEHQDFYVMSVEQSSEKIAAKHESDLDNLAVEETSTTVSTTTSTLKPTAAPRLPSALYDTCRATEDCAGSGTVCESGYCVCESDYHPQDGICRKRCTRFQFECENKGNPLDYPQCIAIYDRCDNIDHCRDASDEMGCGENDAANPAYPPKIQPTPSEPKDEPSINNQPSSSVEESQENSDEDDTEVNSEDTEEPGNNSEEESESQDQNETNDVDSNESSNESVENNSEEESSENNSQPVQSSDEDEQFEEPDDKPKQPAEQAPNSNNKTAVLTQQEENTWREERIEKIEIARPSNRMAVVALSLGLIITAMMLLFVGCRLRNVRKRLRKGRPMNSNEADYLINGMYL